MNYIFDFTNAVGRLFQLALLRTIDSQKRPTRRRISSKWQRLSLRAWSAACSNACYNACYNVCSIACSNACSVACSVACLLVCVFVVASPSASAGTNTSWLASLGSSGGSGGAGVGSHEVTIAGFPARILVGEGYTPGTPTFLAWYLHGDEGNHLTTGMDDIVNANNWVYVAPQAPPGVADPSIFPWDGRDGGSQTVNLNQIKSVLDYMIANYNVYTNMMFGAGASGGSWFYDLYAPSLTEYPTFFNMNCGAIGRGVVATPPDANYVMYSGLKYTIGTDDFLFGNARQSAPVYAGAGYQVETEFLLDVGHCAFNTGQKTQDYWQHIFDRFSGCCSLSIYDRNENYPLYDGTNSSFELEIQTLPTCGWTASVDVAWITLSETTGVGPTSLTYSLSANPNPTPRNGAIQVGDRILEIRQNPTDDMYEENDLLSTATDLTGQQGVPLSSYLGAGVQCDRDRYFFEVIPGEMHLSVQMLHRHSEGNLNMFLYDASNAQVASATSTTDNEFIEYDALAPGRYTLSISGANLCQGYDLVWSRGPIGCTYTVPSGTNLTANAGTYQLAVSATTGCVWYASGPSWVSFPPGQSGTGNGILNYSVAANSNGMPRTASIIISGQAFQILQTGSSAPCSYSVPAGASIGGNIAGYQVAVTTAANCSWSATGPSWINFPAGPNGTGPGNLAYNVTANPTSSQRIGVILIEGESFQVTQAGSVPCSLTITPPSIALPASGGSVVFSVSIPIGCAWNATSPVYSWGSINSASSGNGPGSFGFSADANSSGISRSAVITVGSQTVNIIQAGLPCTLSLSTNQYSASSEGSAGSVNIIAPDGCSWTATTSEAWITIPNPNVSSMQALDLSVTANTTTNSRVGSILIGSEILTITQAGLVCNLSLASTMQTISGGGGMTSVNILAPGGCSWIATASAAWITIPDSTASSAQPLDIVVAPNTASSNRVGSVSIGSDVFTITQLAATVVTQPDLVLLNPALIQLPQSSGGGFSITGQLANAGTAMIDLSAIVPSWNLTAYDGTNVFAAGMATFDSSLLVALLPGQSIPFSASSTVSNNLIYLEIQLDTFDEITESDELNNQIRLDVPHAIEDTNIDSSSVNISCLGRFGEVYQLMQRNDFITGSWNPIGGPRIAIFDGQILEFNFPLGSQTKAMFRIDRQ